MKHVSPSIRTMAKAGILTLLATLVFLTGLPSCKGPKKASGGNSSDIVPESADTWFTGQEWRSDLVPQPSGDNTLLRFSDDGTCLYKGESGTFSERDGRIVISLEDGTRKTVKENEEEFTLEVDGEVFECEETLNSFRRIGLLSYYYSVDWDGKPNFISVVRSEDGESGYLEIKRYGEVSYYEWLTFYEWQSVEEQMSLRTPDKTIRLYPKGRKELADEEGTVVASISGAGFWNNFSIESVDGEDKWYCGKYGTML
ncbi:MAG: hypothetical protein IJ584_04645 [Bacteroidales bacterium]|nr:hypothetical protein [Bacteroidales bacterium]